MSTTINLKGRRFVRRANSGQITNTQWLGEIASIGFALQESLWIESDISKSVLPVNVPTTVDFSGEQYDAFRQSGNAGAPSGSQCVFGGMAVYRIKMPSSASSSFVSSVSFRASSDKFCFGGLKVAAILSNSAMPPTDWDLLRSGGAGGTVDVSGGFATIGSIDGGSVETAGILAETELLVSLSDNHAGTFSLDLSSVTTAYSYLFLAVSLFDFTSLSRREYWVEGSGAIDGNSLMVEFAGEVAADIPTIILANEFSISDTANGSRMDASTETVNLTHSAGIFYSTSNPPTAHMGDLVMMRRIVAMRNVDSIAPRHRSASGQDLGFGVCDDFTHLRGKIGVVYERVETLDVYRLFGVTVMRGSETEGGFVNGISFDTKVDMLPLGQIVRFSFYGMSGMLPSVNLNGALIPQYAAYPHSITDDFVHGRASKFYLNVGVGGGIIFAGAIDSSSTPFSEISLQPLGYHDITNASIEIGTILPFSKPWGLPRHTVIVVTANVIGYTSDWVPADKTSTAIIWEPNDINLHFA